MKPDIELVVWNMRHAQEHWKDLGHAEVALLTEAVPPTEEVLSSMHVHGEWKTAGGSRHWSTAIAWQREAPVDFIHFEPSRAGTLTAVVYDAKVILAACYATWQQDPDHPEWSTGRSDWSALDLVRDLLRLREATRLPVLAAGDWNLWPSSYPNSGGCSVIAPVENLLGENSIHRVALTGRRIRDEDRSSTYGLLPEDAIPTYDHQRRGFPRYEVDHVFASENLAVVAAAKNSPEEWGPSDHCQLHVGVTLPDPAAPSVTREV